MFQHRYKFLWIAFLATYSFLNIIVLEGDRLFQAGLPYNYLFWTILCLSFSVWMSNWLISKFLIQHFKKIHPLIKQFGSSVIFTFLISLLSVEITDLLIGDPFTYTRQNFLLTFAFTFRINLFLNTINAIFFFNRKYKEKELEAEKLKNINIGSQYERLNHQLNPHFLFNNLNALSTLMHDDVEKADIFLHKLSAIYRYISKNVNEELVSLEKELNFLNDYISLLEIRFKNSLLIEISLDKELSKLFIPPVVLQLLIENVVKHNFFTEEKPVKVKIENNGKYLKIINSIQPKTQDVDSMGIGLQNISERYRFLGETIKITETEKHFEVIIPLIEIR
ncbi:sensor histidine kinase [Marivirga sp.]|uniref:sensor histidine kinase n=1 Tax=Marivirga sp. TaxID=2018662 RepID=UPI002D7FDD15|nr:histidine kinase [Marivirga sp.]HET8860040.1 histidine kinase [Marivirga sp.]